MTGAAITNWLRPLRAVLDPAGQVPWCRLNALADQLDSVLAQHPLDAELPPGAERSRRLQRIRQAMANREHVDLTSRSPAFRVFAQFVCGYRDIDLRDTIGLGHGELIAKHAPDRVRNRWLPRLRAGELAGIALTEAHGGSRPAATRTSAVRGPAGVWLISGRKTWISRLTEASVFVVFFRDPKRHLAVAAIDAKDPRLRRLVIPPSGLAGWTWGILDLDAVPIAPDDVFHADGMTILRRHFASYRPLVTATALGGAAAVFDTATHTLGARQTSGEVARLRDSALITLGRSHAQLITALLGTTVAAHLAATAAADAEHWSCAMKAHGVDTAYQTAAELALLLGAWAFRADSPIAKTRRDLNGLLYADGIHDSLYRSVGKHHTTQDSSTPSHLSQPPVDVVPPESTVETEPSYALRRPCSHSAVAPCAAAATATARRSASSGFTLSRASDSV